MEFDPSQIGKKARQRVKAADMINEFQTLTGIVTFIETGTYAGKTIRGVAKNFRTLHTIELSKKLANSAKRACKNFKDIQIHEGASEKILPVLLADIDEPVIFWLDAHYSRGSTQRGETETAILSELKTIKEHSVKEHVILIDDMRTFDSLDEYPTIDEVADILLTINSDYDITIKDDIMRAIIKQTEDEQHPESL